MNKWINHCKEISRDKVNLLCFPYVGASSAYYARWIRFCRDHIHIVPVQYPMRDNRIGEPMQDSYLEMAWQMAEDSEELFASPFALFGHCSGCYMAFELAVAAKKLYGKEPVAMFLSSAVSPENHQMVRTREYTEEAFLKHYGVFDQVSQWDENYKNFFMPVLRADCLMCEEYEYKYQTKLNTKWYVLYGEDDHNITPLQKVYDWQNHFEQDMEPAVVYQGDHFFIDREPEAVCTDIINMLKKQGQEVL